MKATEIGAVHTLNSLLDPARLNRLEAQNAADPGVPSPLGVAEALIWRRCCAATARCSGGSRRPSILALARAARSSGLSPTIAAQLDARLARLADQMARARGGSDSGDWQRGLGGLAPRSRSARQGARRSRAPAAGAAGHADRLIRPAGALLEPK